MVGKTLAVIPRLFHFTDRRNLELIKKLGGVYPLSELTSKGVEIPAPGGNQWSRDADDLKGMGKFVHLCFRSSHPMAFAAQQDGRLGDVTYLEIHPSALNYPGVMFTPDVANKAGVEAIPITDAVELIDYEVLYTQTDWSDPEIQQRLQQAEKCEVLVPCAIPLSLIRNI
ncbi:MAG: DarT ssDNA thymidine ADP-ribosyltransferase family protein [Pseudolabrys sp.]